MEFFALNIIDKIITDRKQDKRFFDIKTELKDNTEIHKKLEKAISENQEKYNVFLQKKQTAIHLLNELWERGLIDEEDVYKHMDNLDIFLLYVYPTSLKFGKYDKKREYPNFLNDLGFVRMGKRSGFYITISKRLPNELKDTRILKHYIIEKMKPIFEQEWNDLLKKIKEQDERTYTEAKKIKFNEHLKASIMVIRSKISKKNLGFVHEKTLPKDFYKIMNGITSLKNIDIPDDKKTKIKKFMLNISFELILYEIPYGDFKSLIDIEPKLKNNLHINSFLDYMDLADLDLINALRENFEDQKAIFYAKLIKKRAREYRNAFLELGITPSQ